MRAKGVAYRGGQILLSLSLADVTEVADTPAATGTPTYMEGSIIRVLIVLSGTIVLPRHLGNVYMRLLQILYVLRYLYFHPRRLIFLFRLLLFGIHFHHHRLRGVDHLNTKYHALTRPLLRRLRHGISRMVFLYFQE